MLINLIQFPREEVLAFQEQLKEIQGTMVNGQFLGSDGTAPSGQEIVVELLNRCLKWAEVVLSRYVHALHRWNNAGSDYGSGKAK